jgi:nucleoside-diphosphate-sugar epimerase
MAQEGAGLRVLYIGGTGTISASCVRLSVESGMDVSVLNRGRNSAGRQLPCEVSWIRADVTDADSVEAVLRDRSFDVVINFLSYDADDARRSILTFKGRAGHYVHISSASVYGKPVLQTPIVESTPTHNRFLEYARAKLRAERALLQAYADEGFPVTIVRPSHTYDDAHPPLPGDWTVVARMTRGAEIPVHGDGTSLWTLTHAEDFALGLVGLIMNPKAIGETFHITSEDVYTWDQIYTIIGTAAGVQAKLVHIPSEFFPVAAPDWPWSDLMVGDLAHSAVFDNSKIRRFVPSFIPKLTFHRSVFRMMNWREAHPNQTSADPATDAILGRLVAGYHLGRQAFVQSAARA